MFEFGLVLALGLVALGLQVAFIVAMVRSSARAKGRASEPPAELLYAMSQLQASGSWSDPHMSCGRDTIREIVAAELDRRGIA
jgi:hypothetical protein